MQLPNNNYVELNEKCIQTEQWLFDISLAGDWGVIADIVVVLALLAACSYKLVIDVFFLAQCSNF